MPEESDLCPVSRCGFEPLAYEPAEREREREREKRERARAREREGDQCPVNSCGLEPLRRDPAHTHTSTLISVHILLYTAIFFFACRSEEGAAALRRDRRVGHGATRRCEAAPPPTPIERRAQE